MLKKVLSLLLVLVMCVGIFAGCTPEKKPSGNSGNNGGTGSNGSEQKEISDFANPLFSEMVSIEISMPANANYTLEGTWLDNTLKAKENLDITWNYMESFTETYALAMADKDVPEITWTNSALQAATYGPAGAYINILDYLEYLPNMKATLDNCKEQGYDLWDAYTDGATGKMWAIPCIHEGNTTPYAFIYRKDVFDKLNMEWPTTQDGFYNALKTLKQAYPNSYPFVLRSMTKNMQGLIYWLPSWGTSMVMQGGKNLFAWDENGNIYYPSTNQGMKECLTFMNKLYDEGLLHPNLLTLTSNEWTTAFSSETSFIGWDKMDRISIQLQPAGEAAGIEGFRLVAGAPIPFGSNGVAGTNSSSPASGYSFLISAMESKERIVELLTFIDWLYCEEGVVTTNWGVEGETWQKDANGGKVLTAALQAEQDPLNTRGLGVGGVYGYKDFDAYLSWQDEATQDSLKLANEYAIIPGAVDLSDLYNKDELQIWDTYAVTFWTDTRNGVQSFIVGASGFDIEKDWDSWVSKITGEKYHYQELKNMHQAVYERYQTK